MKIRIALIIPGLCVLLLAATSCSKQQPTEAPPAPPAQSVSQSAADTVKKAVDTAQGQTEVVKQKTAAAVSAVQTQAAAVVSAVQTQAGAAQSQVATAAAQAQGLIDQARKCLGENKWSEALAVLNQLANQTLTTDQQALVQGLKEQAQKASEAAAKAKATDEAAKAVGGLLPTKK